MSAKPIIPKGTRDFSPTEVAKRQYIIDVIKKNFINFGFNPIETPSFEALETLMGKYGEEGDRLIFKILNSGDYLSKANDKYLSEKDSLRLTPSISEKALRYDLTVPFARYVVQHQNEIDFPFKRFQIQPVWRADRPQRGRFREFYQCDADVVGANSLWQEVELIGLYDAVFYALNLKQVRIKVNNRKIISGIAEVIGVADRIIDFTVALDKLDKIGEEGVRQELIEKGIEEKVINGLQPLFALDGDMHHKLETVKNMLAGSEIGLKGVEELNFIFKNTEELGLKQAILDFDVTLARGLNYYTGAIIEVAAPAGVSMGSIGGGGRYDDLTGAFGLKNMSGVGISFGLDRTYMVLDELELFPKAVFSGLKALFLNFGEDESIYSMKAIKKLRDASISVELYPEKAKISKQMQYADKRKIPFVVIVGSNEMSSDSYILKNLATGEQESVNFEKLMTDLKNNI